MTNISKKQWITSAKEDRIVRSKKKLTAIIVAVITVLLTVSAVAVMLFN